MNNKKIATLAFHNSNNYGAVLQMYALQCVLEKRGADVEVINYICESVGTPQRQHPSFYKFITKYLNLTPPIYNANDIDSSKYNLVITGSDQVWNPSITNGDAAYFLDFVDGNTKKASYAASFGVSEDVKKVEEDLMSKYIRDFDYVSVREPSLVDWTQQYTDVKVKSVLDPTQLLEAQDYINNLQIETNKKSGYILFFSISIDPRFRDFANIISLYFNKTLVVVAGDNQKYAYFEESKRYAFPEPSEWLELIANADLILTDSFHTTMFSVIFRRPFYVYIPRAYEYLRGSTRIIDFLKSTGFTNRTISGIYTPEKIDFEIDFFQAERFLELQRKKSFEYIDEMLS